MAKARIPKSARFNAKPVRPPQGLPDRETLLKFIREAGETDKGSEAVRSHTSALAGDKAVYQAAFRQLGIIQSHDFVQMAQLAHLAGYRHRSAGKRVAIITISGALGAILADKFIGAGLDVPTLPQALQDQLRAGIPDYGMVSNPVDVTGNVVNDPGFVRTAMQALAHLTEDHLEGVTATLEKRPADFTGR